MTEYRRLGISCVHCGKELAARRIIDGHVQIKGLHKLDYIHAESGSRACTVTREARPYDGWQASAAYDAAAAGAGGEGVEP